MATTPCWLESFVLQPIGRTIAPMTFRWERRRRHLRSTFRSVPAADPIRFRLALQRIIRVKANASRSQLVGRPDLEKPRAGARMGHNGNALGSSLFAFAPRPSPPARTREWNFGLGGEAHFALAIVGRLWRGKQTSLGRPPKGKRSECCRVILRCANGLPGKSVASELGPHEHTVGKWRRRFLADRLEGLLDEACPGRPRTIANDQVAAVIERTLRSAPKDATRCRIRTMAVQTGFSQTTIRRIWNASGLQPHRSKTFKLSSDPLFVDKVRDIVGLYLSPPNRALVLSVNEKRTRTGARPQQPVPPMMPSIPERWTLSYVRHGTTSLFTALNTASGFVGMLQASQGDRVLGFPQADDPEGLDAHISIDNYATHKKAAIKTWLVRRPHYSCAFTPTSASWINQIERWLAELTKKQLRRGVHTSIRQLEDDIRPSSHTTMKIRDRIDGPNRPMTSSHQSNASAKKQSAHCAANFNSD